MRPRRLEEVCGQRHLLADGKPLRAALCGGHLYSMVLWGPPGSGKTTLARIFADVMRAEFLQLSAISSGVKDIRAAVDVARANREQGRATVLFVDEVHRFNKSQQDGFLPHIEDGTLVFIGATTENPAFELNNALLSRLRVHVLKPLAGADIRAILSRAVDALAEESAGMPRVDDAAMDALTITAAGDARVALNLLETALQMQRGKTETIGAAEVQAMVDGPGARLDKQGDLYYDQISALHKSIRGSSPDAALYWLSRMLQGGMPPVYIARRLLRMASEDVGNADPRALEVALGAWDVYERLGTPEGELALAQAAVYLACCAKSNAVYQAFGAAWKDAEQSPGAAVPAHLRNAPTRLAKSMGHGADYRYAHNEEHGYSAGQEYFPRELGERRYYKPVDRGLESRIRERLQFFAELDRKARGYNRRP